MMGLEVENLTKYSAAVLARSEAAPGRELACFDLSDGRFNQPPEVPPLFMITWIPVGGAGVPSLAA